MSYYPEITLTLNNGDMNKIDSHLRKRPDLLENYELSQKDKEILETYKSN